MGFKNLFIVENLCPIYKSLFEKCKKLKKEKRIKHLWTYNGVINIKYTDENNEKPKRIYHQEDFDYYFYAVEENNWSTEDED